MVSMNGFLVVGALLVTLCLGNNDSVNAYTPVPPVTSLATGLSNQMYDWRHEQKIRFQAAGDPNAKHAVVLVHGLFVNSDHWRYTLKGLADAGYRAYALDLWGCGYSSKPPRDSAVARLVCGETNRFQEETTSPSILQNVELGTAQGSSRIASVDLRHPLGSPYNFYTWGELIADFTRDVVLSGQTKDESSVTVVCNSIGTISSLQTILDNPGLYDGLFVVNPNFRELHSAEVPFPKLSMPIIRRVQKLLREKGQGLFDLAATPSTVKSILKEPYAVEKAVDDILVDVLLAPLLTEGASDVVFDTLSYSAGPLPEQQLASLAATQSDFPVWVCYGKSDPWTPPARVERLNSFQSVERVVALDGAGHCPHDETPELVNPLLLEFLNRIRVVTPS
jgi:pimeloyl-ACP methyl ester carboxylesterase